MDSNLSTGPNKMALSIDESCAAAGVGRTLIYQEIGAGNLIARKAGRRTLILCSDLETWLNSLPNSKKAGPRLLGETSGPIARRLRSIHEATARIESIPPSGGAAPEDIS